MLPAAATGLVGALALVHRARQRRLNDERDHQYSPSQWSNRLKGVVEEAGSMAIFYTPDDVVINHCTTVATGSASARANFGVPNVELNVAHSAPLSTSDEASIDIFYAKSMDQVVREPSGDVFVYIHGGYWQALSKRDSCFHAETVLNNFKCSAFVAVGYDLCPAVSFKTLVKQVKNAIATVLQKFPKHRVQVCGHSAGGHLGAVVLCTDWGSEYGQPQWTDRLAGFILVSGIYDLRPIQRSYVNDACKMTINEAVKFSPALLPSEDLCKRIPAGVPVVIAAGQHDSPAFRQQSKEFCRLLQTHTKASAKYVELQGEDHFTAMERMVEKDYKLTRIAKEVLGL